MPHRIAGAGLPNADTFMERRLTLPCDHGIDDDGIAHIGETIETFFDR